MNRLSNFLMGALVGAALMFGAMKFHVVRASDGWHLIPKTTGQLGDVYVDIRDFNAQKWLQHKDLAADITIAKKQYLIQDSATSGLQRTVQDVLRDWRKDSGDR